MTAHARLSAMACMAALAACAAPAPPPPAVTVSPEQRATDLRGRSREQVRAAFGPATVVRFDSGREVWCYPYRNAPDGATYGEFVIVFAPNGLAAQQRAQTPLRLQRPCGSGLK